MPLPLREAVLAALAKSPAERVASAEELTRYVIAAAVPSLPPWTEADLDALVPRPATGVHTSPSGPSTWKDGRSPAPLRAPPPRSPRRRRPSPSPPTGAATRPMWPRRRPSRPRRCAPCRRSLSTPRRRERDREAGVTLALAGDRDRRDPRPVAPDLAARRARRPCRAGRHRHRSGALPHRSLPPDTSPPPTRGAHRRGDHASSLRREPAAHRRRDRPKTSRLRASPARRAPESRSIPGKPGALGGTVRATVDVYDR